MPVDDFIMIDKSLFLNLKYYMVKRIKFIVFSNFNCITLMLLWYSILFLNKHLEMKEGKE